MGFKRCGDRLLRGSLLSVLNYGPPLILEKGLHAMPMHMQALDNVPQKLIAGEKIEQLLDRNFKIGGDYT